MHYKINDFSYDDSNGWVKKPAEEYSLTKIQKKLFNYFIQNPNTTISKQTLMDEVWGRTVTENSIEKTLSKLRNVIEEDALNPKILVTHFGHGISFEGVLEKIVEKSNDEITQQASTITKTSWWVYLSVLIFAVIATWFYFYQSKPQTDNKIQTLTGNQHLLILPLTIDDRHGSDEEKEINNLIQLTFENSNNTKKVLFVESGLDNKQTFEKFWQIDKDLVMLQTNVSKNGEVYDAIIEISKGTKPFKKIQISASTLEELVKAQVEFVSDFHNGISINGLNKSNIDVTTPMYLQATKAMNNNDFEQAAKLFELYLKSHDRNYTARFMYGRALYILDKLDLSLAQFNALKASPYYQDNSALIEFHIASNLANLNEKELAIKGIRNYLRNNTQVKAFNKGKLTILLADYLVQLGNNIEALKLYKQAIINVNDKLNPSIYAISYYGQAQIAGNASNDDSVYALLEKSLGYAKLAKDVGTEIAVLQAMSNMLMHNNQWKKGITLKKESIALMELSNSSIDTIPIATDLGQLVAFLHERGLFTQAADVLKRIDKIVKETDSDYVKMIYNHYNISQEMNFFKYDYCQNEIDKQMKLTREKKNYSMMLNAIFLQMELLLAREDRENFIPTWDKYNKLFQNPGLQRYQIYMNLYLSRYYQTIKENAKAIALIAQVSEESLASHDYKFYTEAQNTLAKIYLDDNPQKALDILENVAQYNPNPNPYLEIKAHVLNLLGKKVESLAIMTEAKQGFNEAWSAQNQAFLKELQQQVNH
jgi:DNA-binding winged helix-turn-helix (wHTH) protein